MHDPVVLTDGHTYERRHIEQWLKEHNTSPVSGARLESKHTFPNHALRNAIEEYFEKVLKGHRLAIQQTVTGLRRGKRRVSVELLGTIDSLMQCSILVNADLSIERVLKCIMDEAKSLVGAEVASVFLVDEENQELYSTVNSTGGELRIPISSGVAGRVASSGMPLIVRDAYCDARFNTAVDAKTGFKTRNIMCVPVRSGKWGTIGVAQLINKTSGGILAAVSGKEGSGTEKDHHFTDDDQHFFQVLASQAAVAIVNSGFFELERRTARGGPRCGLGAAHPDCIAELEGKAEQPSCADDDAGSPSGGSDGMPSPSTTAGEQAAGQVAHQPKTPVEPAKALRHALISPLLTEALVSWEVDTIALAEFTDNRPLSVLAGHLLEELGLVRYFELSPTKIACFLAEIERGYSSSVPYHNCAHAASVLHLTHALLSLGGVAEAAALAVPAFGDPERRQRLVTLACLFAAAVHDYEHVGLTNDFLVKGFTERALRHNDKSVNESHHVAAAFEVLHRPECNFLEGLPVQEYRQFRSLVIELVLGTDMAENGNIVNRFRETLGRQQQPETPIPPTEGGDAPASPALVFAPASPRDAVLALQMTLKCADVGHLALGWNSHLRWVRRLEQEFFEQGDREKESGLHDSVSFLMDRDKPGVTQSQVGFFDFVVLPMFRAMVDAFPRAQPMLSAVEANYRRWQAIEAAAEKGSQQTHQAS